MFNSLKIPFAFLVTGVCWAWFSTPLITSLTKHLHTANQDLFRSLNYSVFVIIIAFVLYFEIKRQKRKLVKSEEQYRHLFDSNPNPMWIYNNSNMRFVRVNNAAIEKYGFNRHRFLRMTVNDIRSAGDQNNLQYHKNDEDDGYSFSGQCKHRKIDGETFNVSIIAHPVLFNDKQCSMVMATDVNALIEKENKLQEAYQKLKAANKVLLKISWSNSHELRKPVCSMLGLISLLKQTTVECEKEEIFHLMEKCSVELDRLLRGSSQKVSEIEMVEDIAC